jgi:WXG100 family type VII secretion target
VADEIKVDYPLMDEMTQTFLQGVEQLQDTMQEMMSIANALEDGALLGRGGVAFTEAIRGKLCPAIGRLTDKFQELSEDVKKAKEFAQQADQKSQEYVLA